MTKTMGLSLAKRTLAAFLSALMLCTACGLAPFAIADENAKAQGTSGQHATLTIVSSTKNAMSTEFDKEGCTVWVNKEYSFSEGQVVLDLLKAAKEEGDIKAVIGEDSQYGYYITGLTSDYGVTLSGGAATVDGKGASTYWSLYENGGYASTGASALKLENGGAYQLVWIASGNEDPYPTYTGAPADASAWTAWYKQNPPMRAAGGKVQSIAPPATETVKNAVSADELGTVMLSLASKYKGTSDAWAGMDMAALGMGADVDKETLLANAIKDTKKAAEASIKYIIALSALGFDCTRLSDGDGTFDMIANGVDKYASTANGIYPMINSLWAYSSGKYAAKGATTIDQLVDSLIASQLENGAFGTADDCDTTSMAINAIVPYVNGDAYRQNAVNKALAALKAMQTEDGDWKGASWQGTPGNPNSSSTAFAIVAMTAAGIDPATEWASSKGITPLKALMGYAVKTNDGYMFKWIKDDKEPSDLSTEQAFRSLVAYRGLVAKDGAYDIYADASLGVATIPKADAEGKGAKSPKTGEDMTPLALFAASLICAGALAGLGARTRRRLEE